MKDETYGCVGSDRFDPDDTILMRAVYCLVFNESWPGLCMDSLEASIYRGETLNTYNTMFGWKYFNPHYGLDFHNPTEQLVDKVMEFQTRYCPTIGNMMALPNIAVPIKRQVWNKEDAWMHTIEEEETINMYRGCHGEWHDFFDRFLVVLHSHLVRSDNVDDDLQRLLVANQDYLTRCYGEEGWKNFIDSNILQDYVDDDYVPRQTSAGYYFWKKGIQDEDYHTESLRYIEFAEKVISNRTERIIERLKIRLQLC